MRDDRALIKRAENGVFVIGIALEGQLFSRYELDSKQRKTTRERRWKELDHGLCAGIETCLC